MNVRVCVSGVVVVVMMVVLMLLDMTDAWSAYPTGPVDTCISMAPVHGNATAQTSSAPYVIKTSARCYKPGQALTGKFIYCLPNPCTWIWADIVFG